jgi:hypothetical protein
MKLDFTYFLLRVLRYYYWIFLGCSRTQLNKLKYLVDRGILGKLEVALVQQKSVQAWCTGSAKLEPQLDKIFY